MHIRSHELDAETADRIKREGGIFSCPYLSPITFFISALNVAFIRSHVCGQDLFSSCKCLCNGRGQKISITSKSVQFKDEKYSTNAIIHFISISVWRL